MSDARSRALSLLETAPLIDGHNDFAYMIRGWFQSRTDLGEPDVKDMPIGQTDIKRLNKGMLGGQFWSAFVPCPRDDDQPKDIICSTLQQIDTLHQMFRRWPQVFGLVERAADILPIFRSGRIASLIGVEGLHQIGGSVSVLRMLPRLGVKYVTLCHNRGNEYCDSATADAVHHGLSERGTAMIKEMNQAGLVVDLSHTSHDTQMQVMEVSRAPVIFSHSSCFSLCANPRNVRDEVLELLKQNNGVIMICFIPSLVTPEVLQPSSNAMATSPGASVASVVDHIVYVGTKIGYSHVGIGSDFDGMLEGPDGLDDVACYPGLVEELLGRGVSDNDAMLVIGLNVIRVLQDAENVASRETGEWEFLQDEIIPPWTQEQRAMLVAKGKDRRARAKAAADGESETASR